jgi:hypothetical protein
MFPAFLLSHVRIPNPSHTVRILESDVPAIFGGVGAFAVGVVASLPVR